MDSWSSAACCQNSIFYRAAVLACFTCLCLRQSQSGGSSKRDNAVLLCKQRVLPLQVVWLEVAWVLRFPCQVNQSLQRKLSASFTQNPAILQFSWCWLRLLERCQSKSFARKVPVPVCLRVCAVTDRAHGNNTTAYHKGTLTTK